MLKSSDFSQYILDDANRRMRMLTEPLESGNWGLLKGLSSLGSDFADPGQVEGSTGRHVSYLFFTTDRDHVCEESRSKMILEAPDSPSHPHVVGAQFRLQRIPAMCGDSKKSETFERPRDGISNVYPQVNFESGWMPPCYGVEEWTICIG